MGVKEDYPHQMAVRITYDQRDMLFEMAKHDRGNVQSFLRRLIDTEYERYQRRSKSGNKVVKING